MVSDLRAPGLARISAPSKFLPRTDGLAQSHFPYKLRTPGPRLPAYLGLPLTLDLENHLATLALENHL